MDRLDIIESLKHTPDAVSAAIEGVPEGVLRFRPAEGEWSINEVIGHLRDKAEIWGRRLYMVYSQTDPVLPSFDGEASVVDHDYQDADPRRLIAEMRELRLQTVAMLDHAPDWTRIGQHGDMGRRTLKQFAEALVEMEAEHIDQVRANKAAAAAASR